MPGTAQDIYDEEKSIIKGAFSYYYSFFFKPVSSFNLYLKHTPVPYDIWVSTAGFLATLSPQVQLTHHSI